MLLVLNEVEGESFNKEENKEKVYLQLAKKKPRDGRALEGFVRG